MGPAAQIPYIEGPPEGDIVTLRERKRRGGEEETKSRIPQNPKKI